MKMSLVIGLFCTLSIAATSYSQNEYFSLNIEKSTVKDIFKVIEEQSNYRFFYNDELSDINRDVSLVVQDTKIDDILTGLFLNTGITYTILENNLIVVAPKRSLQQAKISGTVIDASTGEPLPGVNILIEGTTQGVTTDQNGKYAIEISQATLTLIYSYVGYLPEKVITDGKLIIDIALHPDIQSLEEVVVVGYGTQKKSLVTGAISSIKETELSKVTLTGVDQVLQGRLAGVSVTSNSGMPGTGMKVRIRGVGSNGNSEPLYVVDGIVVSNLDYIDPSEIASMEVLKDAASAAIYGAQGANGVVMVTTKTGTYNTAPVIDFDAQFGSSALRNLPKLMDSFEYLTYLHEAGMPNVPDPATAGNSPSTNWMKEIIQPATVQRYTLNISGGTDRSTYLVGGAVSNQQGIIGGPKAAFTRYAFRVNTDHKLKSWLKIGQRVSFSNNIKTSIPQEYTTSVVGGAVMMDPLTPVIYQGELPSNVQNAIANGFKPVTDDDGNYYSIGAYPSNEFSNPLAVTKIDHTKNKTYDFAGNIYAEIEPLKGLKFTSRYGIDSYSNNYRNWNPSFWMGPFKYATIASVTVANENGLKWQWENFVNYQKTFGKHSIGLLGGMSAIKNSWNSMGTTGRGLAQETEEFAEIDYVSSTMYTASGGQGSSTLTSYYGRLEYNFEGKYLFNSTIRRDGSSVMSPEHQWGTFPSVSAGWVLSREEFFSSLIPSDVVNNLKLRASWGQNGSISNVFVGAWNSMIRTGFDLNYPVDDNSTVPGAEPNNLPNYDLRWETSEQTNIGLDVGLFTGRISLTVDYFNKTTKDLLTPGVAPGYTGFGLPYINGGNVRNRGFEFELGIRNADNPFKYDVAFNLTTIDNKVTYLNPAYPRILEPVNRLINVAFEKDYPIWYFYGYKTSGIFQNQQQIEAYINENNLTGYEPQPGDPIVVNTVDDGLISTDDMTYIGNPYPEFTYGMQANLSYKGFDFLVFAQGQVGNEIALVFNRTDFPYSNKLEYWYTNRWTGENSTNSWFRADVDNPYVYASDMMLFNGSYMRIKQLQLGYTLPAMLLQKIAIKSFRIYVSLDDYFTFTKYPGMDPEGGTLEGQAYSVDNMMYPVSGRILFGFNLKF